MPGVVVGGEHGKLDVAGSGGVVRYLRKVAAEQRAEAQPPRPRPAGRTAGRWRSGAAARRELAGGGSSGSPQAAE